MSGLDVTVHLPTVSAPGIPFVIAAVGPKVELAFRTAEEAQQYARDLADTLRDFAHLWRPA